MTDNASIARPYAKAVFEIAQESGEFSSWADSLAHLSMISQDSSFSKLVHDPKITKSKIGDLLFDLVKETLPTGGDHFVRLLADNHRIDILPEIQQQFGDLVAKAKASINAEVITAFALNDEQKQSLSTALQERLGLSVSLKETVDTSLIGGAIIKAGDLVIDGSAKGRLEKLTSSLMR